MELLTWRGANEGLFPGVEALMGFELATLREGLSALRVVTLVRPLACVEQNTKYT